MTNSIVYDRDEQDNIRLKTVLGFKLSYIPI